MKNIKNPKQTTKIPVLNTLEEKGIQLCLYQWWSGIKKTKQNKTKKKKKCPVYLSVFLRINDVHTSYDQGC